MSKHGTEDNPDTREPSSIQQRIPNALTMARVVLAVVFFAILTPWNHKIASAGVQWPLLAAAAVFTLAAITDALDGHLARKWNAVTPFGRVMDPFADKFLVIGAFVYLSGPGFESSFDGKIIQISGVSLWMTILILGRELLVTSIRAVFEAQGMSFGASWAGKLKMVLQSLVIPCVLVILAFDSAAPGSGTRLTIDFLVWATVIVTLLSAWPYIQRAFGSLREVQPK